MKINIVILASLMVAIQSLSASELDQRARFDAIYSRIAPQEQLPEDSQKENEDTTKPGEEQTEPTQPPVEEPPVEEPPAEEPPSEEPPAEQPPADDQEQDQGKAWEELDPRNFIEAVYEFNSLEKYRAAKHYITNRRVQRKSFVNLLQALKVAGLAPMHSDPLLGLYISLRKTELDTVEFLELLKEFTPKAYAAKTKKHNWPLQSAVHYVAISDPSRLEIWALSKLFKLGGMSHKFVDEDLMQAFVDAHGSKLSVAQMHRILNSMNHEDYDVVQREAVLVQIYMHKNAARLTQEDFREDFEALKAKVPFDIRINRVNNMPTDARKNLFYAEHQYFQSIWTKDLFFTYGKLMKTFETNVPARDWTRLVKTFVERNRHRLSEREITKIQDRFFQDA